ncbi:MULTISPECIES: plasmid mobilization protein [unclassified Microcoleus]|uniref:plasmid mobilization protein n=1 Tax=unclassified Microcoleus TaxID=2642155 RepID=UPI002FD6692B
MNTSYIQTTLFDLESYSVNRQPESHNPTTKRTASITVYLTPVEKAQLEKYATSAGKTLSDTMREVIKHLIQGGN